MKKKYLRIIIALVIAITSTIFIVSFSNKGTTIEYKQVLIATQNINKNEKLTSENTSVISVPASTVTEKALRELPKGDNFAKQELFASQIILDEHITQETVEITEHHRSFPISVDLSSIGRLKTGDKIDIFVISQISRDLLPESKKILSGIVVKSILNQNGENFQSDSKSKYDPSVIEVFLTEEQINILNEESAMGVIKVARHL